MKTSDMWKLDCHIPLMSTNCHHLQWISISFGPFCKEGLDSPNFSFVKIPKVPVKKAWRSLNIKLLKITPCYEQFVSPQHPRLQLWVSSYIITTYVRTISQFIKIIPNKIALLSTNCEVKLISQIFNII